MAERHERFRMVRLLSWLSVQRSGRYVAFPLDTMQFCQMLAVSDRDATEERGTARKHGHNRAESQAARK